MSNDLTMTLDELLREMNPEALETHELVWNPDAPKRMAMESTESPFLLVERTKPPVWNPNRPVCVCGHCVTYHNASTPCPFEHCDCLGFRVLEEDK